MGKLDILPVEWLCTVCSGPAEHYKPREGNRPVIALPCGHPNPHGLAQVINKIRTVPGAPRDAA